MTSNPQAEDVSSRRAELAELLVQEAPEVLELSRCAEQAW